MKIECIKEKIQEVVSGVERIANKNASLPILQCILFIVKENTLTLKATNLDVGVEVRIPVKVIKEGIVAVPAYVLGPALGNLKKGKIIISASGGVMIIESEGVVLNLKTIENEEFPLLPQITDNDEIKVNIKDIVFGLKSVIFSVSVSSIKPELGSVYICQKNGFLNFVATDSFRLAEKKIPIKKDVIKNPVLIPLKNAQDLIRVFNEINEEVSLKVSKNQITIDSPYIFFTSRIVDGIFPDYEQIIPAEPVSEVIILKQDLADALKTTSVVVDKYFQVVVSTFPKNSQISIETKNNDVGEGKITLPVKITGEAISMSFSHKYLNEVIPAIVDDSVIMKFGGIHKPLLIEGTTNKLFRYLVMPMNR